MLGCRLPPLCVPSLNNQRRGLRCCSHLDPSGSEGDGSCFIAGSLSRYTLSARLAWIVGGRSHPVQKTLIRLSWPMVMVSRCVFLAPLSDNKYNDDKPHNHYKICIGLTSQNAICFNKIKCDFGRIGKNAIRFAFQVHFRSPPQKKNL